MHPAFSFGFRNGLTIPKAVFESSVGASFKSGRWQSDIVQGVNACDSDDDDAFGSASFGARWMQFMGAAPAWNIVRDRIDTDGQNEREDAREEDEPVENGRDADDTEGAGPLKALLDSLFEQSKPGDEETSPAAGQDGRDGSAGTETGTDPRTEQDERADPKASEDEGGAPGFEAFAPVVLEDGTILHDQGCPCLGCGLREESEIVVNAETDGGAVATVTSAAAATLGDMADYLTSGYWADRGLNLSNSSGTLSHNLGSSGTDANNGVLYYNVSGYSSDSNGLTDARAFLVREAFKLFEATLGIDFEETTSTNTSEVDFFFSDNSSGAYANYSYYSNGTIAVGYVNVASSWSGGTSTYNDYTLQTILHEIGHALGLGHQGNYNGSATFGVSNTFDNDSWQASMMSYFSQTENTNVNASGAYLQTPMSVDWMALDALYGSQGYGVSNAFTENTTWGFNTTVTSDVSDIWAQWSNYANVTASTIVDGGGIDTLDLSGYGNNSVINLAPSDSQSTMPSTSSIGGRTGNLTIAEGTIIENAIGGSGSETFYGNSADNTLTGNGGNDTFHDSAGNDTYLGGSGTDTVLFEGAFSDYSFSVSGSFLQVINVAVDLVHTSVEWLGFSDQTLTYQEIVDSLTSGGNTAPEASDDSYSVDEDVMLTGRNLLSNDSDADGDGLTIATVNGSAVTFGEEIALTSGATLIVNADGTFSYDQNGAFDDLGDGETADDSFTYTVSDGEDTSDAATVSLTINGIQDNRAPVAGNDGFTVGEDDSLTGQNLFANDTDADGDGLTVVEVNGQTGGVGNQITLGSGALLQVNADGTFDYDPNGVFDDLNSGETGTDSFSYQVSDGNGGFDTATVTLTIEGSDDNTAPVADNDGFTVGEDDSLTGQNLFANDSDADGDGLTVVEVNGQAGGVGNQITLGSGALLKVNADGTFDYDPNGAFDDLNSGETGTDSFSYQVSDGNGGFDTATVTLTIEGSDDNTAPVADNDGFTVGEDDSLTGQNLFANDSDADGDGLTVVEVNGLAGGVGNQITLGSGALLKVNADGTFDYDPNGVFDDLNSGETGTDSFSYQVSDGNGGFDTATVTLTIEGSDDNTAPVAQNDTATITEDVGPTNLDVLFNDSDPENDALTITSINGQPITSGGTVTLASGASVTLNADGTLDYNQNGVFDSLDGDEATNDGFSYTIGDGEFTSDASVTLTIEGVHDNEAPVAQNDAATITEDVGPTNLDVLSNDSDPENDALTITSIDGQPISVNQTVVLASGASVTLNADGTLDYNQNGMFDSLGDAEAGTQIFTYTVSDGEFTSAEATVTLTIEGVQDIEAPVAADDSAVVAEDVVLSNLDVLGNDSDPANSSLSITSIDGQVITPGGSVDLASGATVTLNLDGTLDYNQNGIFDNLDDGETATATFSYTVSNGTFSSTADVSLTINGVTDNSDPDASDDAFAVGEDDVLTGQSLFANDTDADGDSLTIVEIDGEAIEFGEAITLDSGALLTINADGTFDYDPNNVFNGLNDGQSAADGFTYRVSDGNGGFDEADVSLTINGSDDNTAPVAGDDGFTVGEDDLLTGQSLFANDTDADGDSLTIVEINGAAIAFGEAITLNSGALLTINADGTFDYDPNNVFSDLNDGQSAADGFTYRVSDGNGGFDEANVSLTINGSDDNTAPVAGDDGFTVAESAALNGQNLFANDTDADGDGLTVVGVNGVEGSVGNTITLGSGALLTVNADGTFDYDPNGAFNDLNSGETATDSFVYQVSDGNGGFDTATVNLTIEGETPPADDPADDPAPVPEPVSNDPVVIDFEGLAPGAYTGEAGLSSSGIDVTTAGQLSGNLSGVTSGFSITADDGGDFDLDSLLLQSVTRRARVTVEAYDDGVLVGSMTVRIRSNGVYELELDERFDSVDEIVVSSRRDKPFYVDDISLMMETTGTASGNQTPLAANDYYQTGEGASVSGHLLLNDSDADGNEISLMSLAGQATGVAILASGAIVTFADDGTFTYDPNGAFNGLYDGETATDTFVYEISDGNGGTDTGEVEITIEGDGKPPEEVQIGFEAGVTCSPFEEEDGFVFTDTYVTTRKRGVSEGEQAGHSIGNSLSFARADGESFDFESAVFTALGRGKVNVTVEGYLDGELVGSDEFFFRANREKTKLLSDEIFDEVDEVVVTADNGIIIDDLNLFV